MLKHNHKHHAAGVFARDDGRPRVRGLARVRVARVEAHVDVERAIVSRGGRARSHSSTPTSRDRETARSDERNNRRGSRRARAGARSAMLDAGARRLGRCHNALVTALLTDTYPGKRTRADG